MMVYLVFWLCLYTNLMLLSTIDLLSLDDAGQLVKQGSQLDKLNKNVSTSMSFNQKATCFPDLNSDFIDEIINRINKNQSIY